MDISVSFPNCPAPLPPNLNKMAGAQNKVPASSWPAGTTESKQKILREWVSSLEEAREKRQWGQILEVSQEYQRLVTA